MITIQQALFGYSNGHHLLVSSDEFNSSELKIMEPLSDLSGNIILDEFDGYLTGYNLESKNCYVLSKTWYAKEMQRPGCVWTQTLLIPYDKITQMEFRNIDFNRCFKRPNLNDANWKDWYATPIVLKNNEYNKDTEPGYESALSESILYLLVDDTSPIIITEKECDIYNDAFMNLIKDYGIKFFEDISFCTGSFANRKYNGEYFSIQIVPQSISKSTWRAKEKNRIVTREKIFNSILLDDINYKEKNLVYAKKFILSLCNVEITRKTLKFGLFYARNIVTNNNFSLKQIMDFAKKCFDDVAVLHSIVENIFFEVFIKRNVNKKMFIDFCSADLDIGDWESNIIEQRLPQLINILLNEDRFTVYDICEELLKVEVNRLGEEAIKLVALNLTYEDLHYFINNNYGVFEVFVCLNWKLAAYDEIWKQGYEVQCDVLKIIEKNKMSVSNTDIIVYRDILNSIFETSKEDIVDRIYQTFGEYAIRIYFEWSKSVSELKKIERWVSICKYNLEVSISEIINRHSLDVFSLVMNTLDPYDKKAQNISIKTWNQLFEGYCKDISNNKSKKAFAQFILPVILLSEKAYPEEILCFAFSTVHEILAEDKMEYTKWEKLSPLLPEVAWHKKWDKCKRLRKAAKRMQCSIEDKV